MENNSYDNKQFSDLLLFIQANFNWQGYALLSLVLELACLVNFFECQLRKKLIEPISSLCDLTSRSIRRTSASKFAVLLSKGLSFIKNSLIESNFNLVFPALEA